MSLYLQLPNGKAFPCQLNGGCFGKSAVVNLVTDDNPNIRLMIRGGRQEMAAELYRLYDAMRNKTVAQVLDITPEQVVKYFEASPDLCEMAADVRAALLGKAAAAASADGQLQQDIDQVRGLVSPSKADIAQALTGQRTYGGATYERINRVYQAISTTSTTPEGVEVEEMAA